MLSLKNRKRDKQIMNNKRRELAYISSLQDDYLLLIILLERETTERDETCKKMTRGLKY